MTSEELIALKEMKKLSPSATREKLGIPKDFTVEKFFGVPVKEVPYDYLRVMIDGAIYEGRKMRARIMEAMQKGEELNEEAKEKTAT